MISSFFPNFDRKLCKPSSYIQVHTYIHVQRRVVYELIYIAIYQLYIYQLYYIYIQLTFKSHRVSVLSHRSNTIRSTYNIVERAILYDASTFPMCSLYFSCQFDYITVPMMEMIRIHRLYPFNGILAHINGLPLRYLHTRALAYGQ